MENLVIGRRPNLYSDSDSDGYDSTDSEYSGPRDMSVVISDLEDLKQRMYDMMTKIDQLDQRKPPGMRSPTKPEITASSLKLDNDEFGFNDIKFDNKKKPASVKAEVKPPVVPKVTKATKAPKAPKAPKVSKQPNTEKTTKAKTAKPPVKKETSAEKKARLKKHMEERAAARKQ